MDYTELSKEPLDVDAISSLVVHESCGAVSMFIGTTRDNFGSKKVISLEYEAYEPMAIKSMKSICNDIRSKWPDIKNIAMFHRLGFVPVKEASVIIAISSPHRESSLQAVSHAIDELKKSVPIWKKELYDDNNAEWKENKELNASNSRLSKRPKLDFDACRIDSAPIPKNLIQINADEKEVSRRIQCFVEKKREEINLNNTLDFIEKRPEVKDDENSCARIYSTVVKQKDSKGHLRIHRVKNEYGPQTKPVYANTLDKLTKNETSAVQIKEEPLDAPIAKASVPIVEQRLENVETFLKISTASRNIHERLKAIEDRILSLESISPEYHHFLGYKRASAPAKPNKQVYSVEDLDKILKNLNENITTS